MINAQVSEAAGDKRQCWRDATRTEFSNFVPEPELGRQNVPS